MVRFALGHPLRNAAATASKPAQFAIVCPLRIQAFSSYQRNALEQQSQDSSRSLSLTPSSEHDAADVNDHPTPLLQRIRIVPESPSYFSARPNFTDDFLRVEALYLKWKTLPRQENPPETLWLGFDEVKAMTGNEPVSETRYRQMIRMLKDLNAIEPVLMPTEVANILEEHKRAFQPSLVKPKTFSVDDWGRSLGVGKRKSSTAKAYLVMGDGEVIVNGKSLTEIFARLHDRESALWALKIANRMDKYNVFAIVKGGGVTGQAEALTLAIAKALLIHEPNLQPRLLEAGCLYRDPRIVERKKPGHLKARKMPTWVKR